MHILRETMLVDPAEIHEMQQGPVAFVRGQALPVRRLSDWLHLPDASGPARRPAVIAHLERGDEIVEVDELIGKQQVVVTPLNPHLGPVPGVDGCAILPDGSVTLILDLQSLAEH